jgi:hypothetical protein
LSRASSSCCAGFTPVFCRPVEHALEAGDGAGEARAIVEGLGVGGGRGGEVADVELGVAEAHEHVGVAGLTDRELGRLGERAGQQLLVAGRAGEALDVAGRGLVGDAGVEQGGEQAERADAVAEDALGHVGGRLGDHHAGLRVELDAGGAAGERVDVLLRLVEAHRHLVAGLEDRSEVVGADAVHQLVVGGEAAGDVAEALEADLGELAQGLDDVGRRLGQPRAGLPHLGELVVAVGLVELRDQQRGRGLRAGGDLDQLHQVAERRRLRRVIAKIDS